MKFIYGLPVYNSADVVEETSKGKGSWRQYRWLCPECGEIAHTLSIAYDGKTEWLKARCTDEDCGHEFAVIE